MSNIPKLDPREEHFFIRGPHPGLKLFIRYCNCSPRVVQRFPR